VNTKVHTLGKAMRIAGTLGSAEIPEKMKTTTAWGGPSFTVLDNAAALKLASTQ
jgi:hypothetical protein